jgi:hypothetical protein
MSKAVKIRKETEIWLLGQTIDTIRGVKLPSNGDVLRRMFFLTEKKINIKEASITIHSELVDIWDKAKIPTRDKQHILTKIKCKYEQYRSLQKSKTKKTEKQKSNEARFQDSLDDLFDIAHANALQMISIEDDRLFLEAQREKGRRGFMSGIDVKYSQQQEKKIRREEQKNKRTLAELLRKQECQTVDCVQLASSSSCSNSSSIGEEEAQPGCSTSTAPATKRVKREHIISPDLAMALDRTKLSDRKAMLVLSAAASACGKDINEVVLSRSTLQRQRSATRKTIANDIKQTFTPNTPLTVHWDGKIMKDVESNETVDRLAIVVSGGGNSKLLAVPKLVSGTGLQTAEAVVTCLEDWNLIDDVKAMCFDTTASNTGEKKGACLILQQKLNKNLLAFACRHHINEIIISDVFNSCYGTSTGPDILLFKRFQTCWDQMDKSNYQTYEDISMSWSENIITFCKSQLKEFHPREDYRELLELTIVYLGGTLEKNISFRRPGALHRARWMARVIYAIKIVLFRENFEMTKKEQRALIRFSRFAVRYYVPNWFVAPNVAATPRNDLEYLQQLQNCEDKQLSSIASKALCRHLWYLSEELVGLAFTDDAVTPDMKKEMVKALQNPTLDNQSKRCRLSDEVPIKDLTLANFVTEKSKLIFQTLGIESSFFEVDPIEWHLRDDYKKAQESVKTLKVVNDNAERAIALIQNFNNHLTKNENQLQYLLQVVERHREKFPEATKMQMRKNLSS